VSGCDVSRWRRHAPAVHLVAAILLSGGLLVQAAQERHPVRGLVLSIDRTGTGFVVSHDPIAGVMGAMAMPFEVRDASELDGVSVGALVEFTMVLTDGRTYAEGVRVRPYETVEQDPLTAARLRMMVDAMRPPTTPRVVAPGSQVPDFTLTNQARRRVSLSSLRGRTVAVNFIYTSCALPQFCFRVANHFGVLQRTFADRLGRDLVLLTITFDPAVDDPDVLGKYAAQWDASPESWHFLTGDVDEVHRVCDLFGVDFFPDEGLMNHSVRTAIIDRDGRLVTNIEGNLYTATQLADLVETVLDAEPHAARQSPGVR
jgi:protein SCO1